jgi:hypothetical protein
MSLKEYFQGIFLILYAGNKTFKASQLIHSEVHAKER